FFSMGFRPFFFLGTLWAALAVPLWVATYALGPVGVPFDTGVAWHAHEMIFGYGAAIIAGFLLTAIPNWTLRAPIAGAMLAGLTLVWLAGRIVMFVQFGPLWLAPVIDSAFLVCLAVLVWREVIGGKNIRNLKVAAAVTVLAGSNIAFHIVQNGQPVLPDRGLRVGMGVILALILLIGGRIIPNFTRNWLAKRDAAPPAPYARFDAVTLIWSSLAIAAWMVAPEHYGSAGAMLIAGLLNTARLARWRFWATVSEPIVLILHIGYAWAAIALLLLGMSGFDPVGFPRLAGIHALGTGAIGVMTLAVMTRATLGHSGRTLKAGPGTVLIYALVVCAAVLRVSTPFLATSLQSILTIGAASLWSLAFLGFAVVYSPYLLRPRLAK
ncbi:MAG: NnrS family protein, partial [Henriciella sp.]|nr:NnrS family protein [Henriciella sp.]